ncbi:hypothetical protein ElyMa_006142000 [Elysia marginata]|uniref:Uncharacterized protein n=1 Tax=Elysia marginata TaxID=1093978 RepID=A0AAV4GX58_9GAST|nr:hypothetical protein ElyMa_006142000 [Elysia marginata]
MKTTHTVISIAVFLTVFCCAYSKENIEGQQDASSTSDIAESQLHQAKKRSAGTEGPDEVSDALFLDDDSSYLPIDDADLDKRSSLFRFGKRQFRYGKRQFRYGKRQFRYGKRQFRYGKRGSLFRFGKRGGGTLFRFGRSGNPATSEEADRQALLRAVLEGYYVPQADEVDEAMAKRSGFHWGSDN